MKANDSLVGGCWIDWVLKPGFRNLSGCGIALGVMMAWLFASPPNGACSESPPASSFTVGVFPPEAVAAGAQWRFKGETTWRDCGEYTDLPIGVYLVEFKPIPGWIIPELDSLFSPFCLTSSSKLGCFVTFKKAPTPADIALTVSASNGCVGVTSFFSFFVSVNNSLLDSWYWEALLVRRTDFSVSGFRDEFTHPYSNCWVYLLAVPFTGYQFSGWSGSASGFRNPLSITVNERKEITALFTPVPLNSFTASQMTDSYFAGGTLVVNCQASYPMERKLLALNWHPVLPPGWTLISAIGVGQPAVVDGTVVVSGTPMKSNPVHFNLLIQVPEGAFGPQEIRAEITYTLDGLTNPISDSPVPNPLVVLDQASPSASLSAHRSPDFPTLEIRGRPGQAYFMQRADSPSSGAWRSLGLVTLKGPTQTWIDTQPATNQPSQFYRAVNLP
jgi:hypothetical protein